MQFESYGLEIFRLLERSIYIYEVVVFPMVTGDENGSGPAHLQIVEG